MKKCTKCQKEKPLNEFYASRAECILCHKNAAKVYYYQRGGKELQRTNYKPIVHRRSRLKLTYGISLTEFENLLVNQNSKCLICLDAFLSDSDACIDHDHRTNQIRGLLCRSCNRGVGYFRDNPIFLRKAAEYLDGFIREGN